MSFQQKLGQCPHFGTKHEGEECKSCEDYNICCRTYARKFLGLEGDAKPKKKPWDRHLG